jgi:hypothetical protein
MIDTIDRGALSRSRIDPFLTVIEYFLLPDWDTLFQLLDYKPACVERGSPVRRRDDDRHGGITDIESPDTMMNDQIDDRVQIIGFRCDPLHLPLGHREICLVLEPLDDPLRARRLAASGNPDEDRKRAGGFVSGSSSKSRNVDWLGDDAAFDHLSLRQQVE